MSRFMITLCVMMFGWIGVNGPVSSLAAAPVTAVQTTIASADATTALTPQTQTMVDLNTADANALMTLHGIGKVKAQAIIEYRQQHGLFKSIEDLANVKGFSQNAVAKLEKSNPNRLEVKVSS